ncbi:hypothetical protein D3C80_1373490 [compost metagenome]
MYLLQIQRVHQPFQNAGIEVRAGTGTDNRIALAPAREIQQDHAITRRHQRFNITAEVRPAAGSGAGTVQHHHGLCTVATVVVMDTQAGFTLLELHEAAGIFFSKVKRLRCHDGVPLSLLFPRCGAD